MQRNSITLCVLTACIALMTAGCNDRTPERPSDPARSAVNKTPTATVSVTPSVPAISAKDVPIQQKNNLALTRMITDAMITAYFFGEGWGSIITKDGLPADDTRYMDMIEPPCWKQNCPPLADGLLQLAATYLVQPQYMGRSSVPPLPEARIRAAKVAVCKSMASDPTPQLTVQSCVDSLVDQKEKIDAETQSRFTKLMNNARSCGDILGHANGQAVWEMLQTIDHGNQAHLFRMMMSNEIRGGSGYLTDPGFCTQLPQRHADQRSARGVAAKLVATAAFLVPPGDVAWRSEDASIQLWGFSEMPWAAIDNDNNIDYRMTWKHIPWFYQDDVSLDEAWRYGAFAFSTTYAVRSGFSDVYREFSEPTAINIAPITTNAANHAESILCGAWAQQQDGPFKRTDDEDAAHEQWLKVCGSGGEHHFDLASAEYQTYHAATVRKFERCAEVFTKKNKATIDALTAKIQALDLPISQLKDWGPIPMLSAKEVVAFLRTHPVRAPKPSDFDEPKDFAFCSAPTTPARGTL